MKVVKLIGSIFSAILIWALYYLMLPTLSISYLDGFLFFAFAAFVVVMNICLWVETDIDDAEFVLFIAVIVVIIATLAGLLFGSGLFNAPTMQQQLGNVETIEYQDMIKQIDTSQIPIVDKALAKKQADKKIGEDIALGSRVELGDPAIQEVNGEIMFVIPLEHTGFFKWNEHRFTPGYITVSASNPNKVKFVTEVDGQKLNICYQKSAFFANDLTRHIRNQGFRNVGLTEFTFEIDDNGRPYYVVTTYKNRTIWRNGEATGVVIVDAQTGETQFYSIKDAPDWVDIIQPESFVENQIDNWGKLIHGVFNFSNKDKIKKTNLTLTVYVEGDCYYFTGMTSVGSDNSCVGFIMVNTRDKKAYMSYMSGATENAAMNSAEGLVSDFGYKATEPLPLNLKGIPTYVMAMKDNEGLIKSYAMVNIENYSISAKGSTLEETSRSYMQAVSRNSGTYAFSDEAYGYTYEGRVKRISAIVEDGSTQYYLIVDGEPDKIFTASYTVSNELAITRGGDTVKISYVDDQNGTVSIVSFDNIAFAETISKQQEKRNELDEGTSALDSENSQIIEVNPEMNEETWNNLSDEEKSKLLNEFMSKAG